jgi:hypothetical protein
MTAEETSDYRDLAAHADLVARAQFRMLVVGRETAWVRTVTGSDPMTAQVSISLDQLTIVGPLGAVRERVAALLELLDEVGDHPERWSDIRLRKVGPNHWRRRAPHPFVRRPPPRQPPV